MRRSWVLGIGGLAAALAALVGWAAFWPDPACSDPGCASARFRLVVELDALAGSDPLPLEAEGPGGKASVRALLAGGGVDVDVRRGAEPLPYDPASGALDVADLHAYAEVWAARSGAGAASGRVYALSVPALRSPEGDLLFGVLFDHAGRGGIAVAPALTRQLFAVRHPEAVPFLQMRTFAHELLHALNRHHVDAVQSQDLRLTVEAPTHCISHVEPGGWRLRESPLWALSPATIRYFQAAEPREVLPGRGHSPFDVRRGSARECELARRTPMGASRTRLGLVRERLLGIVSLAEAAEAEADAAADHGVELRLEAQSAPYPRGFPIIVRVIATNTGERPVRLVGRLAPVYGVVTIEWRRAGDPGWTPFRPLTLLEPADDHRTLLPSGGRTSESVEIYFGEDGWTFPEPGRFELRARLRVDPDAAIVSDPVPLTIAEPTEPEDAAVLAQLLDERGRLDAATGRFLALHGRSRDPDVHARLAAMARDHGTTALGAASQVVIAAPAIRAPIDPRTGRRAAPDLGAAREALERACVDSGLVALGSELLGAAGVTWPRKAQHGGDPAAEAWEGIRARAGSSRLRYGEPRIVPVGSPVEFRWNRATLDAAARRDVRRAARTLRRSGAGTVLVAGHADPSGTCRVNLAIGLARAQAVARELRRAGVPRHAIEVVSLGSQRPADFSSGDAAARKNRRVEIWRVAPGEAS